MHHVFLDNVTKTAADGNKWVTLYANIYAGDAGRIEVKLSISDTALIVFCDKPSVAPYISVDAQVLYAARLFGKLLP